MRISAGSPSIPPVHFRHSWFLVFIFLDFYDFLMIFTASHSFRHHRVLCALLSLASLIFFDFCVLRFDSSTRSGLLFLDLFSSLRFGICQLVPLEEMPLPMESLSVPSFSRPRRSPFCLLLMRLLTLINVFFLPVRPAIFHSQWVGLSTCQRGGHFSQGGGQ